MATKQPTAPSAKTTKKRVVRVDSIGEAHINATFNNIIIALTNTNGEVISWASAGEETSRIGPARKMAQWSVQLARKQSPKDGKQMVIAVLRRGIIPECAIAKASRQVILLLIIVCGAIAARGVESCDGSITTLQIVLIRCHGSFSGKDSRPEVRRNF